MINTPPESAQNLRQRAEGLSRSIEDLNPESTSPEETKRLLHELRVHQIELEMQNEELRRSHEELDASQARYFDLYDLAPIGYMTLSEKKLIREVNLAAANMFNVARNVLVKEPVNRLLPEEYQNIFYQNLKLCIESGTPQEWEMRMIRDNGELFWAHLQATAVENGDFWITLNDISNQKQSEKALYERESHYRTLFENSLIGVTVLDRYSVIIEANDAFCKMLEYEKEEIIGKMHVSDITYKNDIDKSFEMLNKLTSNEIQHYSLEKQYISKSGKIIPALIYVRGLYCINGEYDECTASILDITERKVAENEIKNNERCMASLFEISLYPFTSEQEFLDHALSEVVTLTSSSIGYIYLYSEQKRQFTLNSWSKEVTMLEQQTTYDLDSTGIWGEAVRQRKPILLNDFQAHNPLKKGVPDGHVVLRRFLTVPVIVDDAIVAVVGVANKESDYTDVDSLQLTLFMDAVCKITTSKRAEEERAILESQFQQSQKIEAVGRLAGGVAHDFNNMLGVIIGHAELSLMKMDPSQPNYAALIEIRKAAERSADLTRQLLAFARKETIAPKVLDLNEIVAGMLKMLERLIGEDIQLTWQPGVALWPIKADPSQIDQVLANLCVNVRDAITDIGKMTIKTANCTLDKLWCAAHTGSIPGGYVQITVSDNGCGMNKEVLDHIFEPFFTTKEVGKGTGLGMAMVFGAIKQNNGFIDVVSEPGEGTTITIYLPRYVGKSEQLQTESKPVLRGNETILLVEDEPSILEVTKEMLEMLGYTVLSASTPGKAIGLAREHADEIHMLMTDVIMPEMNGRVLAKNLLSLYPSLKRLFMSGYTADIIAHHGVLEEGIYFIQKPLRINELTAKVREVLDGTAKHAPSTNPRGNQK